MSLMPLQTPSLDFYVLRVGFERHVGSYVDDLEPRDQHSKNYNNMKHDSHHQANNGGEKVANDSTSRYIT